MNALSVFLAACVLILAYILYYKFVNGGTVVFKTLPLIQQTTSANVVGSSTNVFNISVWIYVQTWNNSTSAVTILKDGVDEKRYKLQFGPNKPTLQLVVRGTDRNNTTIVITENFPLQKWVQVVLNFDANSIFDAYLDGSLVISSDYSQNGMKTITEDVPLVTGNSNGPTGYFALLTFTPSTTDPQSVHAKYISESGSSAMQGTQGNYNVKLALTQNAAELKNFTLF